MKRVTILAAVLACLFATAAFAADAAAPGATTTKGEVGTSLGSMQIYGVFKVGFNYFIGNQELGEPVNTPITNAAGNKVGTTTTLQPVQRAQDMQFAINFVYLGFKGWVVDERVTYNVSFNAFFKGSTLNYQEATGVTQDPKTGAFSLSTKTASVGGDQAYVALTDLVLGFHYIPYVGIYVGRILPAFTYSNSTPAANYKFIDDPLMNQNVVHREWEEGLNLGLVTPYLDANLGVYNGREYFPTYEGVWGYMPANAASPVGNTDWNDQNTMKDIHFGVIGKPPLAGMKIRASIWYGLPLDGEKKNSNGSTVEHNARMTMIDADLDYLAPFGLTFVADFLYGNFQWDKKDPASNFLVDRTDPYGELGPAAYTLNTMSYYVTAGYNFGPLLNAPVELLVRYDWWDPDTLNNKNKHPYSIDDELTNITGAVNYYIKNYNAMIRINYIHYMQAWGNYTAMANNYTYQVQLKNLSGAGTQKNGINTDALKIEAQVSF